MYYGYLNIIIMVIIFVMVMFTGGRVRYIDFFSQPPSFDIVIILV
jgi:hypothetical protein